MRPTHHAGLPVLVALVFLLFFATSAAAQPPELTGQACGQTASQPRTTDRSDPAIDFFGARVERVFVYVTPDSDHEDPFEAIEHLLEEQYEVILVTSILDITPTAVERLVIVDGDLGVPGEARLYEGERATSLYVHWNTAAEDLAPLLPTDCSIHSGPGVPAVWDLAGAEAKILTGYADEASFDVRLPLGWAVSGPAEFSTDVVASEIARQDLSLRMDIDDRPAHTWSLSDRTRVAFPLGAELFADGGFTVNASTTTPIVSDVVCPDAGHVGRWVDIGVPYVQAEIAPGELDVARAVAGIGQVSQLTGEPVTVVIDGDASSAKTLEAVGAMAAAIGHYGAPAGWHVLVEDEAPATGSIIRITPVEGEPGQASVAVTDGRAELHLVGDPDDLIELAGAMAHPDRLLYFHDQDVTTLSIPPLSPPNPQEVFGFEHAGYDDRTLRGTGEKSLIYRLHIPAGVPPDRATLALYGTYAPVLSDRESTVSVRINGSEEEIIAVADESGRLEVLHTLTAAKLRPGLNFVKVTVDLGDNNGLACASGPQAWLTVSRASGLAVELEDDPQPPELGVEDARFALAATVDFVAADVVIDHQATPNQLAQALAVIGELANRADGGAPRLVVDGEESLSRHLVVVGQAVDRRALEGVLPMELGQSVGMVAALPSPHANGRVLLVMTGGTDQAVELAIDAALSARVNDVTSHFALIGMDNVRPVDDNAITVIEPEHLAYTEREPGPEVDDYQAWLLAQASRIESAAAPQAEVRRMIAFGLLLVAAGLFGFGWIHRVRRSNTVGNGGVAGAAGSSH